MLLPRRWAISMARFVGRIAFHFLGRRRNEALLHLRRVFGQEKPEMEIQRIARGVFENLAFTAVEILQLPKLNREKVENLVDTREAFRVYDELLKEGKGLISMTAHLGNWELLAGVFASSGKYQGAVVARRARYEPFNQWIVSLRRSLNICTIYRDQASREILSLLSQNQCVGLLPDQDVDSLKGIFANYFGLPAYTTVGPVRLALSSGAPIVTNFLIRMPDHTYKLVIGDVIRPQIKTNRDDAVQEYTERWMNGFEKVIRDYPEQWVWIHNRWKTQLNQKTGTDPQLPVNGGRALQATA